VSGQELRRRLREVDPSLNIIPGGRRRHYKLDKSDWEKAGGTYCPDCKMETVRLSNGLCPVCSRKAKERTEQEIEMEALRRSLHDQRARNRH